MGGADTSVRVTVNYLNLKQPYFHAAEVQISETERTQLANPSAYARFVTSDLPGQLTLSFPVCYWVNLMPSREHMQRASA
jgi:hypothetical protein